MQATVLPVYRVIEITKVNDKVISENRLWEGIDIKILSRHYPPSDIMGADPLGHKEIDSGHIRTDHRFERMIGTGDWEEIDDPRVRLTPMTELEREIDAENRHLFPGDYGLATCNGCGCEERHCECEDEPCEEDDPEPQYDCEDCRDQGCPKCDPETYPPQKQCCYCGGWFDGEELNKNLCTRCEKEQIEETKPNCADGCYTKVANEGDICASCQSWRDEWAKPHCPCGKVHTDPALKEGNLCKECDDIETEYYNQYYVWWRRLLRKVRLMK